MAQIGRPKALDEVKRREICALVSAGCGLEAAARYVCCTPTTIRREALRNPDFHEQLRRAELTAQLSPLRAMQQAAATHWRAAAWLLERTHPKEFARRNPDRLTPDDISMVFTNVFEAIKDEIKDPQLCRQVYNRVRAEFEKCGHERWAARHPRRDPARAKRFYHAFSDAEIEQTRRELEQTAQRLQQISQQESTKNDAPQA